MNTPKQALIKIVGITVVTIALNIGARVVVNKILNNTDFDVPVN